MPIVERHDYARLARVFSHLNDHLAVQALLRGEAAGLALADDPAAPRAGLARAGHRFHLAGDPGLPGFLAELRSYLLDEVYPATRAAGWGGFGLYYDSPGWQTALEDLLQGQQLVVVERAYYEAVDLAHPWREALPPGFELRAADAELLNDPGVQGLDALREEMCSERASVEDFLARSFGVCLVQAGELAGFCLSEYNSGERCEIGIATFEPHQRRGLATLMTWAFAEMAAARGVTRLGWHCFSKNVGSVNTARRAGLAHVRNYPALIALV